MKESKEIKALAEFASVIIAFKQLLVQEYFKSGLGFCATRATLTVLSLQAVR